MSSGYSFSEQQKVTIKERKKFTNFWPFLITEMSNKGVLFVASAGNY